SACLSTPAANWREWLSSFVAGRFPVRLAPKCVHRVSTDVAGCSRSHALPIDGHRAAPKFLGSSCSFFVLCACYWLDALIMLTDACHHPACQFQCGSSRGTICFWRDSSPSRFYKRFQFRLQGLL